MLRSGGVWKTAKVVKNNTRRHPNKVKVAFEGLSSKHSCWIDHHDAKRFGGLPWHRKSELGWSQLP